MTTAETRNKQGLAIRAKLAHMRIAEAKSERNDLIRQAVEAGVSVRQIAKIVGISHQRASQIVSQ